MPQLSLYLDEPTMETLRTNAARSGVSMSKYVSELLHETADSHGWPEGFFDLYGSLADDDSFVEPPEIPWEYDAPRPEL